MTFYFAVFDFAALWSELCNEATLQQARTGQDANVARDSHMPCTTHKQTPESYDDTKRFLFWQIPDLTQFWKANSLSNPRNGWRYKIHRAFLTKRLLSCQSIHMLPWTETILVHQEYNWNERQLSAQLIWHCILTWGLVTYFHGVISSSLIIHSPKNYILGASHEYHERYLRCITVPIFKKFKLLHEKLDFIRLLFIPEKVNKVVFRTVIQFSLHNEVVVVWMWIVTHRIMCLNI